MNGRGIHSRRASQSSTTATHPMSRTRSFSLVGTAKGTTTSGNLNTALKPGMSGCLIFNNIFEANNHRQLLVQAEWRRRNYVGSYVLSLSLPIAAISSSTTADPELTPLGRSQASAAHDMWVTESQHIKPDIVLSSPLSRAMETWLLSSKGLEMGKATVVENCREEHGVHTCDKRQSHSAIAANFPNQFDFEPGFAEEDPLWLPDRRETKIEAQARARNVLDRLFAGEWGIGQCILRTCLAFVRTKLFSRRQYHRPWWYHQCIPRMCGTRYL